MSTLTRQAKRRQSVLDAIRTSDHGEYFAFARRLARAFGRRVADSDPDDLLLLLELRDEVDQAIGLAVIGQRRAGFSWQQIGEALGMTKQAAYARWAHLLVELEPAPDYDQVAP